MAKERYTMRDFAQKHNFQLEKHGCSGSYGGYRVHIRYRLLGNPSCLLTVVAHTAGKNKELEKYPDSLLHKLKDEDGVHTQDLCRGYLQNDPLCERIVHRAGKILANLIFNLGMFLDINTVVLNGDITGFGDKFLDYVRSVMPGSVLPIRVSYSGLKGRAAAVGGIQTAAEAAQAQLLNQAAR